MNKKGFSLPLILLAIAMVVGVFLVWFMLQNNTYKKVVVRLKWKAQAQFAGMFFAEESGFYSRNRLKTEFKEYDPKIDRVEEVSSGQSDFAILSAEEYLKAVDGGKNIKAIAAIYQLSPYAIVSSENSKIESPSDFKGKKLGMKGGNQEQEMFYRLLLSSAGLSEKDAQLVPRDFSTTEVEDLDSGDVDTVGVYRTSELYYFGKNNIPYSIIYPEQFGINIYNDILVTRKSLLDEDPELVKNFLQATVEGWESVVKDNDGGIKATLKFATTDSYKDEEYEKFILTKSIPLIKSNPSTHIGSMTFANWNKLYTQMAELGLVKGNLDIEDLFTNDYLP